MVLIFNIIITSTILIKTRESTGIFFFLIVAYKVLVGILIGLVTSLILKNNSTDLSFSSSH